MIAVKAQNISPNPLADYRANEQLQITRIMNN